MASLKSLVEKHGFNIVVKPEIPPGPEFQILEEDPMNKKYYRVYYFYSDHFWSIMKECETTNDYFFVRKADENA